MEHSEQFIKALPYLEKLERVRYLNSILCYDLETSAPVKGLEDESRLMNHFSAEVAEIFQDAMFKDIIKKGLADKNTSPIERRVFESYLSEMTLIDKVGLEEYKKFLENTSKSNEMWKSCKENNDYETYLPYWQKCVDSCRVMAKARMTSSTKTPYDALLNLYEPGETSEYLNNLFNPVKREIIKMLPMVISNQSMHKLPAIKPYGYGSQCTMAYKLLDLINYDLDRGQLRTSAHPFSIDISRNDVRLTTSYDVKDFRSNMFTILHEGGHCLQFQNKSDEEYENFAQGLNTAANCETHSRFYENYIGRSREFVPYLKNICAKELDPGFNYMSDDDFYRIINEVKPGLIRCDADELTYTLHIIIRYEIERDLINGLIECADVPEVWNKKYKEYLGVVVPNDTMGCLQDVHWSDGSFGYFPSYALGNFYGAMIRETMQEDIEFTELVREGRMREILSWLKDYDFTYDWQKPNDWIKSVTKKELSSEAFIRYLQDKFLKF